MSEYDHLETDEAIAEHDKRVRAEVIDKLEAFVLSLRHGNTYTEPKETNPEHRNDAEIPSG